MTNEAPPGEPVAAEEKSTRPGAIDEAPKPAVPDVVTGRRWFEIWLPPIIILIGTVIVGALTYNASVSAALVDAKFEAVSKDIDSINRELANLRSDLQVRVLRLEGHHMTDSGANADRDVALHLPDSPLPALGSGARHDDVELAVDPVR